MCLKLNRKFAPASFDQRIIRLKLHANLHYLQMTWKKKSNEPERETDHKMNCIAQ